MKFSTTAIAFAAAAALTGSAASANHIWINEFHYDNPGADVGEFVEVGLRTPNGSGFTASDYAVQLYNGSNGEVYTTTGTLNTFGTINSFPVAGSDSTITLYSMSFPSNGIQNGSPDGLALVNLTNSTVESFLSYEGTFTATTGLASGMTSTDVMATEPGVGNTTSLAAMGTGNSADQFNAASFMLTETATPGGINTGQTFAAPGSDVPEPTALAVIGLGGLALVGRRRRA